MPWTTHRCLRWLLVCAVVVTTAAEHCVDLDACRCGKYRGKAPAMVSAVEHAAKDALAEFGYEPPRESGAPG